jgi:hypothetical protein
MEHAGSDEHVIRCSICARDLIVKDTVNNGVAFLSHLKIDHGITYIPQRMTETKTKSSSSQRYKTLEHR